MTDRNYELVYLMKEMIMKSNFIKKTNAFQMHQYINDNISVRKSQLAGKTEELGYFN
jgi:hypothetical protein